MARFASELDGHSGLREMRGHGLMLGIDLTKPCGVLTQRAADAGLLISVTADSVIRLVPPLIMTTDEADEVADILLPLIHAFLAE
jgi:acetylornithine aminotransferase